jgi:crotonobetainyl-CoA:carnitine CoA-transferase CaiB-like acyl-CoA transferase
MLHSENSEVGGDPLRHYPPFAKDGQSAMFHSINRGKGSVALPFRDPETHLKLNELIKSTDVLVESFRPGTLEKLLKIKHVNELLENNPNLIVVRITGFGNGCSDPGHDINFMASAGVLG